MYHPLMTLILAPTRSNILLEAIHRANRIVRTRVPPQKLPLKLRLRLFPLMRTHESLRNLLHAIMPVYLSLRLLNRPLRHPHFLPENPPLSKHLPAV